MVKYYQLYLFVSGSTTYTCMLNKDGGVQADVTVSVLENESCHDALSLSSEGKKGTVLHNIC